MDRMGKKFLEYVSTVMDRGGNVVCSSLQALSRRSFPSARTNATRPDVCGCHFEPS